MKWVPAVLAAIAIGSASMFAGSAAAAPEPPPEPEASESCSIGTAQGRGTTGAGDEFEFRVCEEGPAMTDTTGHFTSTTGGGPDGGQTRGGPTVCADMNEHSMAFLYTVEEPAGDAGQQVLVVVTDGGPNPDDDRITTVGPLPAETFGGDCGLGTDRAQRGTTSWGPLSSGDITVELKR